MHVVRYTPDHRDDWNRFVEEAFNGVFLFDRGYMDYHADRFLDHSLLFYDRQRLVAVVPAHEKDGEWHSHGGLTYGGFVLGSPLSQRAVLRLFSALVDALSAWGCRRAFYKALPAIYYDRTYANLEYGLTHAGFRLRRRDAATTIVLAERPQSSDGRVRSLRKARRASLRVEESLDFDRFFELQNARLEEKYGVVAVHRADEMRLLQSRFPKNIRMFGVDEDGVRVAGAIVYTTNRLMHLQYFGMNDRGRAIGATDLLIDHLIGVCRASALEVFDFGISTEQEGRVLNEGLNRYKESFGGVTTLYDAYVRDFE